MGISKLSMKKKLEVLKKKKERTLFIWLPHTIRSKDEVAQFFTGTFEVKLTRQKCRHCYVLFPTAEEMMKNVQAAKGKEINGKKIKVAPAKVEINKTKPVKKKIVMPKVEEDVKLTQSLFISNVKCGTRIQEIKEALVGCVSVKLLKPHTEHSRSAIAKMENIQIAAEYLRQEREAPTVKGRKLILKPDTRVKHKKRKSKPLKIYNGEPELKSSPAKEIKIEVSDNEESEASEEEDV